MADITAELTLVASTANLAEDSMEKAGRKIESIGDKMEKSFGERRWTHLLDAFGLIHSGAAAGFAPAMSSAQLITAAMGRYSEGGYISGPSGIDTVPAWLTPGEFVVNADAARRNAWLLPAINDDVTLPGNLSASSMAGTQRFAPGGLVQQQSMPPVHVTANIVVNPPPGANPRDIARAVVDELARLKIRGRG